MALFNNFKEKISTLNLVFILCGYPLFVSIFLGIFSYSSFMTISYRAISLVISLLVILAHLPNRKIVPYTTQLFYLFWAILIFRIWYDTFFRIDFNIHSDERFKLWTFLLGVCVLPMISIVSSLKSIDFNKACKWTYILSFVSLIFTIIFNPLMLDMKVSQRINGNEAMFTISLGHAAVIAALLSFVYLSKKRGGLLRKIIYISTFVISLFISLRAGSRGPLVSFAVAMLTYLLCRGMFSTKNVIRTIAIIIVLVASQAFIFQIVKTVSPVFVQRMEATIEDGDTSERGPLYSEGVKLFLESPIIGSQFALETKGGGTIYTHNMILDAFMGMGILGGLLLIFLCYKAIKICCNMFYRKSEYVWVALIFMETFMGLMTSGAIYQHNNFSPLMVLVFGLPYVHRQYMKKRSILVLILRRIRVFKLS